MIAKNTVFHEVVTMDGIVHHGTFRLTGMESTHLPMVVDGDCVIPLCSVRSMLRNQSLRLFRGQDEVGNRRQQGVS